MRDADGTMWREVRLSIVVEVMADTVEDATYHGFLKLPDLVSWDDLGLWTIEVLPDPEAADE